MMQVPLLLIAMILCAISVAPAQKGIARSSESHLTFGVTDERKLITRDMGGGLLLRVVKEMTVGQTHYGWRVEVVRKPYRPSSRNLLYYSRRTLGAHPSQVYAWHVATGQFPNVRELEASTTPVSVRVELINPVAEGEGAESRFVSGEVRISWASKPRRPRADE